MVSVEVIDTQAALNGISRLYVHTYTFQCVCVWYVRNNNKEKEAMNLRERWGIWQILKGGCMEGFGSRKELGK